ncbi:CPBP family intramembrane metalloprotease [Alcaligenaceae bacterium]|nr:CPBP family intramembrane metalloprotease [Alcaligenaceae bacterium]
MTVDSPVLVKPPKPRFRDEFADFARFVVRPSFTPRLPPREIENGWIQDWFPSVPLVGLFKWALFLWVVNLILFGPIAVWAATSSGATHRLDVYNMPWLQALIWAPIVEELVFRYGMRRPAYAWWLAPIATVAMLLGPKWPGILLIAAVLVMCWAPYLSGAKWARRSTPWRWRLYYWRAFPVVFHLASLLFAAVHLYNFKLHHTAWWLLPLLVLPQWLTGLVLGWQRCRRGIGASMLLHCIFNSGPLLVVWILLQIAGDALT